MALAFFSISMIDATRFGSRHETSIFIHRHLSSLNSIQVFPAIELFDINILLILLNIMIPRLAISFLRNPLILVNICLRTGELSSKLISADNNAWSRLEESIDVLKTTVCRLKCIISELRGLLSG